MTPPPETPDRAADSVAETAITDLLRAARIVPVLTIDDPTRAVDLARALADAGLHTIEITLRTDGALAAIENVARQAPEVVVGAGSVLNGDQLRDAEAAGARFAVSPGLTTRLAAAASKRGLPFLPGVATASEAMTARDAGFHVLKLFPAHLLGGVAFARALRGPLGNLRFCPTGGIDATSYRAYLAEPNVLCVGGSWMVAQDHVAAGDWAAVTQYAQERTA